MIGDNVFQKVQNAQQTAGNVFNNMATQGLSPTAYQSFMNPFIDDVINRAQADNERARQMQINNNAAAAERANAYGGSRSGIVDAMTNAEFDRNAMNMAANQRLQGFNTAQNLAQNDMNFRSQGAQNLQSLGSQMFGQGTQGLQQQQQMADLTQAQDQQLLNAARAQVLERLGYPASSLATAIGLFGNLPRSTLESGDTPGLFDVLGGIGTFLSGGGPLSYFRNLF